MMFEDLITRIKVGKGYVYKNDFLFSTLIYHMKRRDV
jgi:hypothetical protein